MIASFAVMWIDLPVYKSKSASREMKEEESYSRVYALLVRR